MLKERKRAREERGTIKNAMTIKTTEQNDQISNSVITVIKTTILCEY
jgi:hypothetical protein